MKAKKLLALILMLVLIIGMFAGCVSGEQSTSSPSAMDTSDTSTDTATSTPSEEAGEETTEATGETIKIGHIVDLTGAEANTGKEAERALQYAVDTIGEISGRKVEIIVGDSQSDPSSAVDVARKMVEQDGVVAIFGPTQIGHKSNVAEYVKNAGVPVIFYNPTPVGLMMNNEWVIGASGATPQLPTVMADYVYNELGYRTIHTIAKDDTGGKSYMDPFVEVFTSLGGEVISQQWAPAPTADFAPYLSNLADADAIVGWTSGTNAIEFWKTWYNMGINDRLPVVAAFHGAFTDYFIGSALKGSDPKVSEAFVGTRAPMSYAYDIDTPENKEFSEGWEAEFGEVPSGSNLPGACYQTILLFKAAVEALDGDTSDLAALRDALLSADITGPEGRTFFDGSNAATKDIYIVQVVEMEDGSYNYSMVKEYEDVPPTGLAY